MAALEIRPLSERCCPLLLSQINAEAGFVSRGPKSSTGLVAKSLEISGTEVGHLSRTTFSRARSVNRFNASIDAGLRAQAGPHLRPAAIRAAQGSARR